MLAKVIWIAAAGRGVGLLSFHEPDVFSDFLRGNGFIQAIAHKQRFAQIVEAEISARALHGVLALAVATDYALDALVEMIVGKSVKMAQMMDKKVLGLVENMSYFTCPNCSARHHIFGESAADEIAGKFGIPNTLKLPVNPDFAKAIDAGAAESLSIPEIEPFLDSIIALVGS